MYVKVPIIMPSLLVPVAPPGPSRLRYHLGLDFMDPACLVPELDLLHLINSNWAAQRAIRLRYLCGPPGLAGYLALLLDTRKSSPQQ